jgi:ubiquitin-like modifier-activating enzyme ATG7
MPLLQFAPFGSLVQPPFWHAVTQLKIDVLRLSDKPIDVAAAYTPGRTIKDRETGADVALGCHLSLGGDAFKESAQCVSLGSGCDSW